MWLTSDKKAFLTRILGVEKVKELERQLAAAEMRKAGKGRKWMDGIKGERALPRSWSDMDTAQVLQVFAALISNIATSAELGAAEKVRLVQQAADELPGRLPQGGGAKDAEVREFIDRSIEAFTAATLPLIQTKAAVKELHPYTEALRERIGAVLDPQGGRQPVAGATMSLMAPRRRVERQPSSHPAQAYVDDLLEGGAE